MLSLVDTTGLDLAIGAAMMAVPVVLGIGAQLFFSALLHTSNKRGK